MTDYSEIYNKQRAFFRTNKTKEIDFRMKALEDLKAAVQKNEKQLIDSLKADLNKSEFDAYSTEIGFVLKEISFILSNLRPWAKPEKAKTPMTHIGSTSYIYSEPYGVALIIAPWNYPFQLSISPLIGAIAAGNCAILKPSEFTPKTSEVVAQLIKDTFPEEFVTVALGGIETSQALLKEKSDYIFFTGSVPVGKIIMEAASKNLTPITLELGGKSPCIIHKDANLKIAAKRVAWGKFTNAGQTCIAPDYLYLHKDSRDEFLTYFKDSIKELYGENSLNNENYTRIVSENHFKRLSSFLSNGETLLGGKVDTKKLLIEPTLLTNISWEDPVMQDEIFGPILPILEYSHLTEVIEGIHNHPKPLALYIFSESENVQQEVLSSVSFGGGCINDTIYHIANPYLPFGGVGPSGTGAYHGKGSFDTFSHKKSVLKQTTKFDIPLRYPNVKNGLKKIKLLLK
ncbi:aldehyde dehydrogenase [Cytobacillus suaedae]|nr:aldehyde dehydrogenase [Cytobacillus suaedae]